MKFLTRLTLFLTIILAVSPVSQLLAAEDDPPIDQGMSKYDTNMIENGDFELGLNDTKWNKFPPASMSVVESVYEPVSGGSFAFKITENDLPLWSTSGINQLIPVLPNEVYKLKADIFFDDIETVGDPAINTSLFTMKITFWGGDFQELGLDNYVDVDYPNDVYTTTELAGTIPADARYAMINLDLKAKVEGGGGSVYIDNIELKYDWVPQNLHHTSKTDTTIDLLWSPPTDMSVFDHYEVYRGDQLIGSTQSPYFTATGLSATTAHVFTVKAVTTNNSYVPKPSNSWRAATDSMEGYTKIMPIGDSLTHGWQVMGGYRYSLRDALIADELKVDFVGSQSTDSNQSQFDQEHEGYPGLRAEQIYDAMDQQIAVYEPDIILLLAGTNDMFDTDQAASAHLDIEAMITHITSKLPHTRVIVSSIPRILQDLQNPDPATLDLRVRAFNNAVKTYVDQHSNENVSFVDMYPMITEEYYQPSSNDPNVDRIHPTAAGFVVMADVWYDAVQAIITDEPEIIDTTPPTLPILSPSNVTLNSISINWTSSDDNIAMSHYMLEIWKNDVRIHNLFIVPTTYNFIGLSSDTEYSFIVKAFDWNQNYTASQPLTIRTLAESNPGGLPDGLPGGSPGGPPATTTPPTAALAPPVQGDLMEYQKTVDGNKLIYTPNKQKAIDTLKSAAKDLSIVVTPTKDKPFNELELQLPGDIVVMANSNNKPIIVSSGNFIIQIPPNFITIKAGDTVTLSVRIKPSIVGDKLLEQSLVARSAMYELELKINDKIISSFNKPIQLTIIPIAGGDHLVSGIYLQDPLTQAWSYVGGKLTANGNMIAQLQHFSPYALLESTKSFNDISSHWAKLDIESLAAKQIVSGLSADLFNPTGDVTRAQFAAMIARALQLKAVEGDLPFNDVTSDAWYFSDVKAAYQAGLISGISEDRFTPNAQITREQMAVMIVNAYSYKANLTLDQLIATTTPTTTSASTYQDSDQISSWAQTYVEAAANLEFIFGIDGSFMPKQYADRAQSAAFINRLLNK